MPVVQACGTPVQTGCCPVDPKDVSKAEKEALHAQHEAAEACKKQQKAIAKAQHEIDEEYAKQQSRIDKANAHLNHEVSEFQDANAKYEAFFGGPSEATAEVTPQPEPVIIRSKPEEPRRRNKAPTGTRTTSGNFRNTSCASDGAGTSTSREAEAVAQDCKRF